MEQDFDALGFWEGNCRAARATARALYGVHNDAKMVGITVGAFFVLPDQGSFIKYMPVTGYCFYSTLRVCYFEYDFQKRLWVDLEGEKSCDQHFVPCLREVAACLATEETVKINEKVYTLYM